MGKYLYMALALSLSACGQQMGPMGPAGPQGERGEKGEQGEIGPVGPQGAPGIGCTVTSVAGGSEIACADETTATVLNGADGNDGSDGQSGTLVQTIQLCPTVSGGLFNEYLIMIGSDLFGVYASGQKIGITKLWPGNWRTTDGRTCNFTINANGSVTY